MKDEILTLAGIQTQTGIRNCGGTRAFYEKMLLEYLQLDSYSKAVLAHAQGDSDALFLELHTMKGLTATLGMDELSVHTASVCTKLHKEYPEAILPETLQTLADENEAVCNAIREAAAADTSIGGKSGPSAG